METLPSTSTGPRLARRYCGTSGNGDVVAGLSIDGAQFFLAPESPALGTRSPGSAGFTTVRIESFVADPVEINKQALAAGATEHSRVEEHQHTTRGPMPTKRMLQERLWIRSDICGLLGSS